MITKALAKELMKGDYIPTGGRVVDPASLRFRRTREFEVYRCGQRTGYDPQSGSIWCGDLAEYIAREGTGVVPLCERHRPPAAQIDQ